MPTTTTLLTAAMLARVEALKSECHTSIMSNDAQNLGWSYGDYTRLTTLEQYLEWRLAR